MFKRIFFFLSFLSIFLLSSLVQAQTPADADFDGNGRVDFPDFIAFAQAFGSGQDRYDLDGSGHVGFSDFLAFVQVYGSVVGGGVSATLTDIDRVEDLQDLFNRDTGLPRLILLVSPT